MLKQNSGGFLPGQHKGTFTNSAFSTIELKNAIDRDQLVVFYQPQVDVLSGKMIGVEALIRWNHPILGMVSPGHFVPLAEKSGLILPIGEWVLKTACSQNNVWHSLYGSPVVISVNLSPFQLLQTDIVKEIKKALDETGLDAQFLNLEITESSLLDVDRCVNALQSLKALGVGITIDDFGTGYNTFFYLKRIPVTGIKIDRFFVSACATDVTDATIVKTLISMAHDMNMSVIAEGVETRQQLDFLQQHLCDAAQGYLFGRPLPAAELEHTFMRIQC